MMKQMMLHMQTEKNYGLKCERNEKDVSYWLLVIQCTLKTNKLKIFLQRWGLAIFHLTCVSIPTYNLSSFDE